MRSPIEDDNFFVELDISEFNLCRAYAAEDYVSVRVCVREDNNEKWRRIDTG